MITRESVRGVFPVRPLVEVAEFLDSRRKPVKESERKPGPYPYYGANGQQGSIDGYLFDEPLILLAEDGGFFDQPERGIAYRVSGKTWVNNHAHVIRPRKGMDLAFLCRVLENYNVLPFISGSTRAKLTKGQAEKIEIPVPPLDEQKRIAAVLDQADELRRKRQRAIDRLNQLGQAVFHEMFGDPLGAPREGIEWITETLETNVEFMDYRGKTPLKSDSGIRLITARNVKMGVINLDPQEFVEAESYDAWMTRGFPQKGDILFTTEAPLGHVAQLETDEKVVIGQRLITMKPNLDLIRPTYLEFFLRTTAFRTKMFENSTGSTVIGIKSKLLKKIEIRYPPLIVQEKFESAINQLRLTTSAFGKEAICIDSLFASLKHRAFRGEL
jgi:type I restriction enzyme S subunit